MQAPTAYINHITTTVPEHDVHTAFVEYAVTNLSGSQRRVFERMVERSRIAHRWAGMPDLHAFYHDDPDSVGLHERIREYRRQSIPLADATVDRLADVVHLDAVTHVIVVSSTGFFTPGLDVHLMKRYGMSPDVERTDIMFMGCYAGVNGLRAAHHIVRSDPAATVLVLTLEICSLHLKRSESLEELLSYLIFSDGAAAAIVSASPTGIALDAFRSALLPDSEELMTLNVGDKTIQMFLSGQVPIALGRALADPALQKQILGGSSVRDVTCWAIHPGGRSILDAVGESLELTPDDLAVSRKVLADYGNMASATILFVLDSILAQGRTVRDGCAMGFGPGLAAETFTFSIR